ncbi:MAG: ATP synthase F1 subunit gamma [Rickettsiaceae bacterium]|nr:MAG: ATP synthase F1 subunit gamma [Rickettsiaceae bacterium]
MSNLKHLRDRVKSVKSSEKITRAMQMVAASKLQKFKHLIEGAESYLSMATSIADNMIKNISIQDLAIEEQAYFGSGDKVLFVIVTSQRGLCGSFNSSIIKAVKNDIIKLENQGKKVEIIVIGKKGYEHLLKEYTKYIDSYFNMPKQGYDNLVALIREKITTKLIKSGINECYIYYNKFINAMTQITTCQRILPIKSISDSNDTNTQAEYNKEQNYTRFKLEGENLLSKVMELYLTSLFSFVFLQSRASEEGARMTAMDNATKNAKEIIEKFTLKLNRSRQSTITEELIEIISGSEAAAN